LLAIEQLEAMNQYDASKSRERIKRLRRNHWMFLFNGILATFLLLLFLISSWSYEGHKGWIWIFAILGPGSLARYFFDRWRINREQERLRKQTENDECRIDSAVL
jgi:hypothetical protein